MKKILFQLITLLITTFGYSQSCDLFFSEYLEGASNNKAIEVYNPLNAPVDLVDYKIFRYNNGSVTPTDSIQMLGTLAPGSVFVAGNPSAVAAILSVSDTLHTITFFNGDDALELRYMPTNTTIDVIGVIGVDPGVNWVVGTGATSEFTLVRQSSIVNGETNWAVSVTEWDVYPQNTATFIGSHSGTPCCTNSFSSILTTACDSYTWPQTGQTYTTSGNYNDTIPNVTGCDSIITLMLTINSSTYSSQSITTCDSYTWPQTAQTYTLSGNYNDTIPNVSGCDSIITLMLTINSSTYSSQSITACDSYTWSQTGQTYTTSGNYNDTIPNVAGCDSIITLMLTINSSTYSSQSITA
ncbi:MAG: lamin tail domain-containing protein, partial [Fluviicola sp.]|nr:lamin tail domain-containing protein [Fluviicola sp.]